MSVAHTLRRYKSSPLFYSSNKVDLRALHILLRLVCNLYPCRPELPTSDRFMLVKKNLPVRAI
jgi:hypothetical protein